MKEKTLKRLAELIDCEDPIYSLETLVFHELKKNGMGENIELYDGIVEYFTAQRTEYTREYVIGGDSNDLKSIPGIIKGLATVVTALICKNFAVLCGWNSALAGAAGWGTSRGFIELADEATANFLNLQALSKYHREIFDLVGEVYSKDAFTIEDFAEIARSEKYKGRLDKTDYPTLQHSIKFLSDNGYFEETDGMYQIGTLVLTTREAMADAFQQILSKIHWDMLGGAV